MKTATAREVFETNTFGTTAITRSADVAEAVWRAATDASSPPRIVAGADAVALAGSL